MVIDDLTAPFRSRKFICNKILSKFDIDYFLEFLTLMIFFKFYVYLFLSDPTLFSCDCDKSPLLIKIKLTL